MTIIDAITSSPLNVFFTIVIGIGLAYLYCRKPSSSSTSSSSSSSSSSTSIGLSHPNRAFSNHSTIRSSVGVGTAVIDEELQRAIAQIERQERDMIRQEQDEAYQKSLKTDREKRLKREEENKDKEAKEKAEQEKKAQAEELHQRLMKLKRDIEVNLPHNSASAQQQDIVKLVFKLPDGTRIKQNFCKTDQVKHLYWFVFSLENAPLQFKLTTNFPKRDLPGRPPMPEDFEANDPTSTSSTGPNCEETLDEAGLTETQIIFVYDLEA